MTPRDAGEPFFFYGAPLLFSVKGEERFPVCHFEVKELEVRG